MHGSEHPRPDPQAWRESAACRGMDPAIFIPAKDGHAIGAVAKAKAVCAVCPVIDDCRSEHHDEPLGVWFGTTPAERTPAKRDACGTNGGYRLHYRHHEHPCPACVDAQNAYRRARRARARAEGRVAS